MNSTEISGQIQDFLSSLPGVVDTAQLDKNDIPAVLEAEGANEKIQLVKLVNLGIREVVKRDYIFLFIKDAGFRPPPCPTIYLVEEPVTEGPAKKEPATETEEPETGGNGGVVASLEIGGKKYPIVGEEVMDKNKTYHEDHMFIQDGFVMFPKRRKNRQNVPSYFLIPPIPFPELEQNKDRFGIENIISVSPSTKCDDFLRERYNLSTSPEYATIIVGFDRSV